MFFIVGEQTRRTIAYVRDFVADVFEFFDQPRGPESLRRFLRAGQKSCRTRAGANQGNLLRLTDNFDRQSLSPEVSENPARARLAETPYRPFHWQETDYPGTK